MLPGSSRTDFNIEDPDSDTTTVLDLENLTPDTRYGYVLHARDADRVLLGHNRVRGFRTPPAYGERRPFQFALFSCHMPYRQSGLFGKRTEVRNLEMWDFLGASLRRHRGEIDLVVAGGDQCYTDGVPTLDIWRYLNRRMRKEGETLLPDEASMLSWYRDVYCGYWGFPSVQEVFDGFPTYMIWDDHELGDGWGSYYVREDGAGDVVDRMLPALEEKGLTRSEGREFAARMFRAARRAYVEYEHSHNPRTEEGVFDYSFRRGGCAYYVLDGRGHRDVNRESFRILGREQFERFKDWVTELDPGEAAFLFVVSAVPILHTRAGLVNADERWLMEHAGLDDDLRDSWEHDLHDEERGALLDLLFGAAARGIRVCVLSGDVHVSAVFSIDDGEGRRIYQLTSSAITYGLSRAVSWVLSQGAAGRRGDCGRAQVPAAGVVRRQLVRIDQRRSGNRRMLVQAVREAEAGSAAIAGPGRDRPAQPLGGQDPAVLARGSRRRHRKYSGRYRGYFSRSLVGWKAAAPPSPVGDGLGHLAQPLSVPVHVGQDRQGMGRELPGKADADGDLRRLSRRQDQLPLRGIDGNAVH